MQHIQCANLIKGARDRDLTETLENGLLYQNMKFQVTVPSYIAPEF